MTSAIPFSSLADQVFEHLIDGQCAALTGLSNTGKSTLMRCMASISSQERWQKTKGWNGTMVYVDCNRAVAISAQAFYEVVVRSLLEGLGGELNQGLADSLRDYHQSITESTNAFSASLAFNLALSDLCENVDKELCLLLDEFDEIYAALDDRALLNLRALRDRFSDNLQFVTATVREMRLLRGREYADEFAELFVHSTYPLPRMRDEEIHLMLDELDLPYLDETKRGLCKEFGGGHPGLIIAVAQVLGCDQAAPGVEVFTRVSREPQPQAECMKIWNQLTETEQQALNTLVLDQDTVLQSGLPPGQVAILERTGVIRSGRIFSPIFERFISRRGSHHDVAVQGVHLDSDSGDVWVDGIRIPVLTELEFKLLTLLHDRLDKLTDKYRIVTAVWGEEYLGDVDDARVEKLISRLRSKIEDDPSNPRYLVTLRGRGYKLLSHAHHDQTQ
jgi:DNA-binding winged helix-turn-helix (wHTH) protein